MLNKSTGQRIRTSFILLFVLLVFSGLFAAGYEIEEGYIINPVKTNAGVVFTDEYENTVYLTAGNNTEILFSSPGAGRYLSFSADGNLIGYKYINPETGLQQSAVYNLTTGNIRYLTSPETVAGQVSFSDNGKIAYTSGQTLFIDNSGVVNSYDLGYYNNRTAISPDGASIVFRGEEGKQYVINLNDGSRFLAADHEEELGNATWSSDSRYIAFESVTAKIYVADIIAGRLDFVSEGEQPKWSAEENTFTFFKRDFNFDEFALLNSDVFTYNVETETLTNITNTPEVIETHPSYSSGNIVYATYFDRSILEKNNAAENASVLYTAEQPLKVNFYENYKGVQAVTEDEPDYVHIHQVYDTKQSWDQGRVCCGATSAMEVLASYEILEPNEIYTYGHTSDYGFYVSEPYTYRNYTYSGYTGRWSSGGHGFLWNTSSSLGSSPYSNMVNYLSKHQVNASKSDNPSWYKVQSEMESEYPYILCSTGLTNGHIVVAVGVYGTGSTHTLYVNDPYGDKNAGSYGYIRNGKNAVYDWSDENTGHQKVTPVVWAVTAHYEYRIKVKDVYPTDNAEDISCSVNMLFQFDTPIDQQTIAGKITLTDEDGNNVDVAVDNNTLADGLLSIEPQQHLSANTYYTVTVKTGIKNLEGNPLKEDIVRTFKTGEDAVPEGEVVNSFDNVSDWVSVTSNQASTGLDNDNSFFEINNEKSYNNNTSGNLRYVATGEEFEAVVESQNRISLGNDASKSVAVAIYGDLSYNEAVIYLEDESGTTYGYHLDTLDYTGWKVKFIPLSQTDIEGNIYFNSLAVKSTEVGNSEGSVYFDILTLGTTPTVIVSHLPLDKEVNISVNDPVTFVFNKPMNKESVENALQFEPAAEGTFAWNGDATEVTFTPAESWLGKTEYTVTLGESAKDADNVLIHSAYHFRFTTERVELLFMQSYPENGMEEVSRSVEIRLYFDGAINASTLSGKVKMVDSDGEKVAVKVNGGGYSDGQIFFEPMTRLKRNAEYSVVLTDGIGDTGGLLLQEEKIVTFRTETTEIASGNIVDGFESYNNWVQPTESEYSYNLDPYNTYVNIQGLKKAEGTSSIQLDYYFTQDSAACVLYNTLEPNVGSDGEFGLWIFGDNSGNNVEFAFKTSNRIEVEVTPINWTGWKFKSVDLGEIEPGSEKSFLWVALKNAGIGNDSGVVYFDGIQNNVVTGVEDNNEIPLVYSLGQNYPNPFNPVTKISFSIPESGSVKLEVFNILGQKVASLVNEKMNAGIHEVDFNASQLSSGVYLYRIDAAGFSSVKKMMLLK